MSWSIYPPIRGTWEELPDALSDEQLQTAERSNVGSSEAAQIAYKTALFAIEDGAVGSPIRLAAAQRRFRIDISGHHNPDYEPVAGMADDYVTITVSQI